MSTVCWYLTLCDSELKKSWSCMILVARKETFWGIQLAFLYESKTDTVAKVEVLSSKQSTLYAALPHVVTRQCREGWSYSCLILFSHTLVTRLHYLVAAGTTCCVLQQSVRGAKSKNPKRNTIGKRRGWKKYEDDYVETGMILFRQYGLHVYPGENVSFTAFFLAFYCL